MKKFARKLKRGKDSFEGPNDDQSVNNPQLREIAVDEIDDVRTTIEVLAKRFKTILDSEDDQIHQEQKELIREQELLLQQKRKAENYLDSIRKSIHQMDPTEENFLDHNMSKQEGQIRHLESNIRNLEEIENEQWKRIHDRLQNDANERKINNIRSDFERQMVINNRRTPSKNEWESNWTNSQTAMDIEERNLQQMIEDVKNQQRSILQEKEALQETAKQWQIQNEELNKRNNDFEVQLFRQQNLTETETQKLNLMNDAINQNR